MPAPAYRPKKPVKAPRGIGDAGSRGGGVSAGRTRPRPAVKVKPKPTAPAKSTPQPYKAAADAGPPPPPAAPAKVEPRRKGTGKYQTFKKDVNVGKNQILGFERGKGYYAKDVPASKGKAKAAAARASRPKSTGKSEAQLVVEAALAPLLASYKGQQEQLAREQEEERRVLQGFTREFLGYLGGQAPYMQSIYGKASGDISAFANAAASGFTAGDPSGQIQADLQAIGAPAEQQQQVAQGVQAAYPGAAAVLLATGGQIPNEMLAGQAQGKIGYAQAMPGIQSLASLNALKSLLFNQQSARSQLAQTLAEINAKRPSLLLEARRAQQEAADDAFKRELLAREFGLDVAKARSQDAYRQGSLAVRGGELKLRQARAAADLAFRQAQEAWNQRVDLARLNQAERRLEIAARKAYQAERGGKPITAGQYATAKRQALKEARVYYEGKENAQGDVTVPPIDYQDALFKLMRGFGLKLVDAQSILNTYWQPGESNRPWLTFQQRQALKRKGVKPGRIASAMWNEQLAIQLLSLL